MPAFILAPAIVLMASLATGVSPQPRGAGGTGGGISSQQQPASWLLDCAMLRTEKCRLSVQKHATQSPSGSTQKLAEVLLEEWPLDATDPRLAKPRLAWVDLPDFQELAHLYPKAVTSAALLVKCVVQPDGKVSQATLIKKTESDELNRRILASFSKAVYRPARANGQYVQSTANFLYRLEPRRGD